MATKAELEAQVAEQQEWIDELESAVMVFDPFACVVGIAEMQRATALDIGVSTAKMRAVVDLCDRIRAREDAEMILAHDQECAEDARYGLGCE